jgi:phosphoenolpyruvate---glycerone phosphotransferase subunit DhaM
VGSSVLTTRTVLEEQPDPSVVMVDAPFVEGAVTATDSADPATVVTAAKEAPHAHKF